MAARMVASAGAIAEIAGVRATPPSAASSAVRARDAHAADCVLRQRCVTQVRVVVRPTAPSRPAEEPKKGSNKPVLTGT